jgi:hypothetical protein
MYIFRTMFYKNIIGFSIFIIYISLLCNFCSIIVKIISVARFALRRSNDFGVCIYQCNYGVNMDTLTNGW